MNKKEHIEYKTIKNQKSMKKTLSIIQNKAVTKVIFIPFVFILLLVVTGCGSDDDNTPGDETMQEEETTLDFNLLVDSWEAQDFVFENSSSSLPDTNVTGQGGTVILEVSDSGDFTFTLMFVEPEETIMNSGVFRVQNNMLQARFDPNTDFSNVEVEVDQQSLMIEGNGLFDLSGDGSNVPIRFIGTFFRN